MDEQTANDAPQTTEEVITEQEPTTTPEQTETAPEPVTIDWQAELEKADAKELRKHPRIAGIIGSELQRARQEERQRITDETAAKEREKLQAELEQLAQTDPEEFTKRWLTRQGQQKTLSQLNQLEAKIINDTAQAIGRAVRDVPEWQEMTEAEQREFLEPLAKVPDSEIPATFNKMMAELIGDRRAKKLLAEWKSKELAKEREAVRQEEAAKLMQASDAPDTRGPKGQAKQDIKAMSDEDFDKYWNSLKGI